MGHELNNAMLHGLRNRVSWGRSKLESLDQQQKKRHGSHTCQGKPLGLETLSGHVLQLRGGTWLLLYSAVSSDGNLGAGWWYKLSASCPERGKSGCLRELVGNFGKCSQLWVIHVTHFWPKGAHILSEKWDKLTHMKIEYGWDLCQGWEWSL